MRGGGTCPWTKPRDQSWLTSHFSAALLAARPEALAGQLHFGSRSDSPAAICLIDCGMQKSVAQQLDGMRRHLAEVEMELARYAHKHGLTEEARRLLTASPLSAERSTNQRPDKPWPGLN